MLQRVAATKYPKELVVSSIATLIVVFAIILYFTSLTARTYMQDAFNSVFKIVITDRQLGKISQIHSNVPYCNTASPRQTLDLYIPKRAVDQPQDPMPLVVFIHGGGWRSGDKSNDIVASYGNDFLLAGYAVATLNYRLYPEVSYPEPNEDIACSLRFLASNSQTYQLSNSGWVLFGDSAGAQLAAYAMSDESINQPIDYFVGFYGPYDLVAHISADRGDIDAWNYTNQGRSARAASPIYREPKSDATYLLFHGAKDQTVHISQSLGFYQTLIDEQITAKITSVKNADHYFSPRSTPTSTRIKSSIILEIASD